MNDVSDFEIDGEYIAPEPFDRAVANFDVRCTENKISETMNVTLTASFSSDFVEIELSDGGSLEVLCEIHKAMIVAKPYACEIDALEECVVTGAFEYEQSFSEKRSTSSILNFDTSLGGSAKPGNGAGNIGVDLKAGKKLHREEGGQYSISGRKKAKQVQFGTDQIMIDRNPDGLPLEGTLIDHVDCFKVRAGRHKGPYGILFELRVRRGWMQLTDPQPVNLTGKLKGVWDRVFSNDDKNAKFHQEAFRLLVQHLVEKGLQNTKNKTEAVLAARVIRAVPSKTGDTDVVLGALSPKPIVLAVEDLERVLTHEPKQILQKFDELGISTESLKSDLYPLVFRSDITRLGIVDMLEFTGWEQSEEAELCKHFYNCLSEVRNHERRRHALGEKNPEILSRPNLGFNWVEVSSLFSNVEAPVRVTVVSGLHEAGKEYFVPKWVDNFLIFTLSKCPTTWNLEYSELAVYDYGIVLEVKVTKPLDAEDLLTVGEDFFIGEFLLKGDWEESRELSVKTTKSARIIS